MTIWHKLIKNEQPYAWLDWIEQGLKEYEGRLYREDWKLIRVGDIIEFYTKDQKTLTVEIIGLERYQDFGETFDNCNSRLVPIKGITREEVMEIYCDIFKMTKEEIKNIGVIAIKVKKL